MINVNNLVYGEPENKRKVKEKKINYVKKINEFKQFLINFVDVLDLAIKRKITYSPIEFSEFTGINFDFNQQEFKRKIQKVNLKLTVNGFIKFLNEIDSEELIENIKNTDYGIKHLTINDSDYYGIIFKYNSIFYSFESNSFLLFDDISDYFIKQEKIKNKQFENQELKNPNNYYEVERETTLENQENNNKINNNQDLEPITNKDEEISDNSLDYNSLDSLLNNYNKKI